MWGTVTLPTDKGPRKIRGPVADSLRYGIGSLFAILILPESMARVNLLAGVSRVGASPGRRKEAPPLRASLTAPGAILGVITMPVTIVFYPPAAIPLGLLLAIVAAIVVWHLRRGGRAMVRRTPRGSVTFTLDSTRKNERKAR
jgi:hypothetical protein